MQPAFCWVKDECRYIRVQFEQKFQGDGPWKCAYFGCCWIQCAYFLSTKTSNVHNQSTLKSNTRNVHDKNHIGFKMCIVQIILPFKYWILNMRILNPLWFSLYKFKIHQDLKVDTWNLAWFNLCTVKFEHVSQSAWSKRNRR